MHVYEVNYVLRQYLSSGVHPQIYLLNLDVGMGHHALHQHNLYVIYRSSYNVENSYRPVARGYLF